MNFVPVSAIDGVNLISPPSFTVSLRKWYNGPTLVGLLGEHTRVRQMLYALLIRNRSIGTTTSFARAAPSDTYIQRI